MLDSQDNCPPSRCPDNPSRCANPDQADDDHDNVGDVCDNCSPQVCAARGWTGGVAGPCSNPGQEDSDGDKTGDACDTCPFTPNGNANGLSPSPEQYGDSDQDGVPDACDDCNAPNGYRACNAATDCIFSAVKSCLDIGRLGKCLFSGNACGGNQDCPPSANPHLPNVCIIGSSPNGRCATQDDADGDGVGGACDTCEGSGLGNTSVLANSNAEREFKENVEARGDYCDPVPLMVSRAIFGGRSDSDHVGSTLTDTTFLTTAGLGVGGTAYRITENAGFRYCSCFGDRGEKLGRAACLATKCPSEPNAYDTWIPVSVSTSTAQPLTFPTAQPTVGLEISRPFSTDINCNDDFPHPGVSEECRLGRSQDIVRWWHQVDINQGRVPQNAARETVGLFLSHVKWTERATSPRDRATAGRLRDSYEYVATPLVVPPTISGRGFGFPCAHGGCQFIWRRDWAIDPAEYLADPSPLELVSFYARLAPQADGTVLAIGGTSNPQFDVSSALSPAVLALMSQSSVSFLTPSEPGSRGLRGMTSLASSVAIATPWRQLAERPLGLLQQGGQLSVLGRGHGVRAAVQSASDSNAVRFVPGDRDAARAVFSGAEQSVYLVGGHRPDGSATGEVWHYSLASDLWTHLFLGLRPGPLPQDVRAIAYDNRSRRIVIVDQPVPSALPHTPGNAHTRILVIDVATNRMISASLKPHGGTGKLSLVAADDGTFILVRGVANGKRWSAHRFNVDPSGRVRWLGHMSGAGEIADDPFSTNKGVLMPVLRHGNQDFVPLSPPSAFEHDHDDEPDDL